MMRRGNFCREREGDERAAINRQLVTEANLASTNVATDLEAQIKTAKNELAVTGGERSENTHGKALATLFRLPATEAAAAATMQQAALAILLELVIVACFVAFELLGREVNGRRSADAVIEPALAAPLGNYHRRPTASLFPQSTL